jgi:hypothetical protein
MTFLRKMFTFFLKIAAAIGGLYLLMLLVAHGWQHWENFLQQEGRTAILEAAEAVIKEDHRLQMETTARYSSIPPCEEDKDCNDDDPCTTNRCRGGHWGKEAHCAFPFKWVSEEDQLCQIVTCDRSNGTQQGFRVADGTPCKKRRWDHLDSRCERGQCYPSSLFVCNDENPCTRDIQNKYGCTTKPLRDGVDCGQGGKCYHEVCHPPNFP